MTKILAYETALAHQDKNGAIADLNGELKAQQKLRAPAESLLNELSRIRDSEEVRTGEILVRIGVLNSGDSDGVVFREAKINFGDSELPFRSEKYTVIKSHSFEEIDFSVDTPRGTKASLDRWSGLVIKRQQEKFTITVTAGGKALNADGRLPE